MKEMKEAEETHVDPKELPKVDMNNMPNTMESIFEWLRGFQGVTKIPLAYVVRRKEEVTPGDNDLPGNYTSPEEEMVQRAPHFEMVNGVKEMDPTFVTDNRKVWDLLSSLLRDKDPWTYMKPYMKSRDGRKAYLAVWNHYLGASNVDNQANEAERTLERTQ